MTNPSPDPDKKDRPLIEAIIETGQAAFQAAKLDPAFGDIPVLGNAFKWVRALDSVRDRALMIKLAGFLEGVGSLSNRHRVSMKKRLEDTDGARRVGGALFLTIDQLSEDRQALLLGQIFRAYLDEMIDNEDMLRLSRAVQMAFIDDLTMFLECHQLEIAAGWPYMERLLAAGLARARIRTTHQPESRPNFEPSALGHTLRKIFKDRQRSEPRAMSSFYV